MDKRVSYRLNPQTSLVERYVERRFGAHWSGLSAVPMGTMAEFRRRYPNVPVEGTDTGKTSEPKQESLEEMLRRASPEQLEALGYLRVYEGDEDAGEVGDEDFLGFDDGDTD